MRVTARGRAGVATIGVALLAMTLGTPTATPQVTTPPPQPEVAAVISGPASITFGQPAVLGVSFRGNVTKHRWDLDNSGRFATDGGTARTIIARFQKPGTYTVRVRGEGASEPAELSKQIVVRRPTRAGIEYTPALPRPGQQVTFKIVTRSEPGTKAAFYAWKINGVQPRKRTLKLKRARAVAAGFRARSSATGDYSVTLGGGSEPTAAPTLKRSFSRAGVYHMKTSVIGADGARTTVEADVKVGTSKSLDQIMPSGGRRPSAQAGPCTLQAGGQCAAMAIETNPAAQGLPTTFSNATPDFNWCVEIPIVRGNATNVGRIKLARVFAKLDLGYPAPEAFFEPSAFNEQAFGNQVAGGQQGQVARASQFSTSMETVCKAFKSQAVSWDFGDGTKVTPPQGQDKVSPVVEHAYASTGIKQAVLVVRRFYFDLTKFPNPANEEDFAQAASEAFRKSEAELIAEGILKSYLQSVRTPVEVLRADCDGIFLRGIKVRAYAIPGAYEGNPLASFSEDSCFLERKLNGSNKSIWEPMPGAQVSLNGIKVEAPAGDTVIVDPQDNKLSAMNGGTLGLTFIHLPQDGFNAKYFNAGTTQQIVVPQPAQDPQLGRPVATLPDYGGSLATGSLNGFTVSGARILLSANTSAFARLSFAPRAPLNGATPSVVLGGYAARAAHHTQADFRMDLNNINIGPFRTKEFTLGHYPGEGWQGGGKFELDLGAASYELNAGFFPPSGGTTSKCSQLGATAGPSGLSLPDSGGFDFAGGSVKTSPGNGIPVGPAEIYCFGASFQQSPFVLTGLVGARVPFGTNLISADVCVLIAVLNDNESAAGCGFGPLAPNEYTARNGDEVWISGRGTVTLLGAMDIGSAGFDIHAGGGILATSAFGRVNAEFGPFYIEGGVTGTIIAAPNPGFEFTGEVELGLGGCPACVDVKGIVSSKGIGACVDVLVLSGGFVYKWSGSLDVFAGCSWSKFSSIRVSVGSMARSDFRAPVGGSPLARTSASTVDVEAGRPVSFQAIGTTADVPKIVVTAPNGARIGNTGEKPYERIGGVGFLNIAAQAPPQPGRIGRQRFGSVPAQVIVTVPKPAKGKYVVDARPGTAALQKVQASVRQESPRILAKIRTLGKQRFLDYVVRPVPGQSVEFLEEGATTGRKIGAIRPGQGGTGRFKFPPGFGLAGPRNVFAIISQDGVPVRRIQVARYVAPGPPKVGVPSQVRSERNARGVLRTCWRSVANVKGYEVTVTGTDGRVLRQRVKGTCATFPGFDASVGASAVVKAIAAWGQSAASGKGTLSRVGPPDPVLKF